MSLMTTERPLRYPDPRKSARFLKDVLLIFAGVVVYTFGWTAFILSQDITSGGLAGLTTIIQLATNIPASIPYNIINVGLLLLSIWILGWRFSMKTIIAVLMLTVTIPVGQALFTPMVGQGLEVYHNLPTWLTSTLPNFGPLLAPDEPFVALIVGAGLCGAGLGIVFSANGSTGGTDIIVAIINKYSTLSLGRAMIFMDAIIVTTGAVVSHFFGPQYSWGTALGKLAFSFIEITIVGQMLDYIMEANKQSVQLLIVSTKYEQLSEAITRRLGHGCTILHGEGGYSHQQMHVVLVTIRKNLRGGLYQVINSVDPNAFISESTVHGVYGQGFDSIERVAGRKKK